jgi:hypothetical protein
VAGELQQKLAGVESALAGALAASSRATHGKDGLVARCAELEELLKTFKDASTALGDEAAELRVQVAALQASLREVSEASQRAKVERAGASEVAAADHAARLGAVAEEKQMAVDSSEKLRTSYESLARELISEQKARTNDMEQQLLASHGTHAELLEAHGRVTAELAATCQNAHEREKQASEVRRALEARLEGEAAKRRETEKQLTSHALQPTRLTPRRPLRPRLRWLKSV